MRDCRSLIQAVAGKERLGACVQGVRKGRDTMTDIREAVARAIWTHGDGWQSWNDAAMTDRSMTYRQADAVLAALAPWLMPEDYSPITEAIVEAVALLLSTEISKKLLKSDLKAGLEQAYLLVTMNCEPPRQAALAGGEGNE